MKHLSNGYGHRKQSTRGQELLLQEYEKVILLPMYTQMWHEMVNQALVGTGKKKAQLVYWENLMLDGSWSQIQGLAPSLEWDSEAGWLNRTCP